MSLGTGFHLKPATWNFRTKFAKKEYFRSKTENVNATTEFCIFELATHPPEKQLRLS